MTRKIALITGVTGQDGSYLAEFLLAKGYEVHGIKRRASLFNTQRVDHIYEDPHVEHQRFVLHYGDLTDSSNLTRILQQVRPDEVYNLGAQSHVAVSFEAPEYTADVDAMGTLRLLEAIRLLGLQDRTRFYQASTSELYGLVQETPQRETNSAMVQGAWYPYGDAYGEAKCLTVGMHTADECSTITAPDPLVASFPNEGGKMCTAGTVARVINGPEPSGMMPDYSNIWGAGIGLDLASTGGDNPMKTPFNFTAAGITGISFEIDMVPLPGLRVEFPMPATEGHADGSNYWGAAMTFPPSPVVAGVNVVKWNEVMGPRGAIPFDPTQVLSIQFHVPASAAASGTFQYCISNLTLLTN
jgi:hypothetical protein